MRLSDLRAPRLLALETTQIAIPVALLIAAALIIALLARAFVSRRARPSGQLPAAPKRETIEPAKVPIPEVAPPADRLAREKRAREELAEAEQQLQVAREAAGREPQSSAARAEADRHERGVAALPRRA